ncbi:MAG: protein kinase family protein [Planctomycetaceae bacterium]|nr:protein kinase family protein [Planctomycetaceae bacterium]
MTIADEPDPTIIDLVAEEFTQRCRRGEVPTVTEYIERYPQVADRLKSLLPSVMMLEKAKHNRPLGGSALKRSLDSLPDFRIIREVGQGGMGIVYEAEQVTLERRVALKVLPLRSRLDAKRFTRFEREAQAAARLHHSNIVPVLSFGEHDGLYYYVMQFIDGRGLDQVIRDWKNEQALPGVKPDSERWTEIAQMGVDVASALQHAHDQGILHRDIKPANVMLDGHGIIWVTDFGLAKQMDNEDLTRTGDIVGTLQYMAPEQFQSQSDVRSDVYSLGLTLYELMTLEAGFQDSNPSRLIRRKSEDQPPNPRKLNPLIPRDLETVVLKAIAREPANRYPTAQAFANDLRRFLEDRPILARRTTAIERLWRWSRRNRLIATLTATATASLLLAATVGWAGYVRTGKALERESKLRQQAELATKRADANVALSLAAIEDLFDKISKRGNGAMNRRPFDGHGPHPGGPPGERQGPPGGRFGPPPRGPGGFGGPPGPGGFNRPPPPRPEDGPGGRPLRVAQDEAELLKSILTFYEKFAASNSGSSSYVQREAAKAYHQVGNLQGLLGQQEQSAVAHRRAVELFEAQAAIGPLETRSQHDLIESYLGAKSVDKSSVALAAREKELRRALQLADDLSAESGHRPEHTGLVAGARKELGIVLFKMGLIADAEQNLRHAVELLDPVIERHPDEPLMRFERLAARQALGDFLGKQNRQAESLAALQGCIDDLDAITGAGRDGPPIPPNISDYFDGVSASLREIGETDLATKLATDANEYRDQRPPYRE